MKVLKFGGTSVANSESISNVISILNSNRNDNLLIVGLVLASSALSVVYLWKIVEVMWVRAAGVDAMEISERPALYIPLWIVAIGNIWLGLDAGWFVGAAEAAATSLLGSGG